MASQMVMDAVEARLSAWTRCPIIGFNTVGEPPADASEFLRVQFPVVDETQISVGAPGSQLFREEGGIWFALCIPVGKSIKPYGAWIDELRDLFRAKQFDGVSTYEAPPATQDNDAENGNYVRQSFVVEYYADILR